MRAAFTISHWTTASWDLRVPRWMVFFEVASFLEADWRAVLGAVSLDEVV